MLINVFDSAREQLNSQAKIVHSISRENPILIGFDELRELGITYSKEHLRRLETAGQFPERVRLTPSRIAWMFNEVMAWINDRAQVRSIETGNQETREAQ